MNETRRDRIRTGRSPLLVIITLVLALVGGPRPFDAMTAAHGQGTATAVVAGVGTAAPLPATLRQALGDQVRVSVIAGAMTDQLPAVALWAVERRHLAPGADTGWIASGGTELLYVESGRVSVSTDAGTQTTVGPGQQLALTGPERFASRVRNTGDSCAVWLRLSTTARPGGAAVSSEVPGPTLGKPVSCGDDASLIGFLGQSTYPTLPAFLFVARLSWEALGSLPRQGFPGPTGMVVERGEVRIHASPPGSEQTSVAMTLTPGSSMVIDAGVAYGVDAGSDGAVALLAGIVGINAAPHREPSPTPKDQTRLATSGGKSVSDSPVMRRLLTVLPISPLL